MKTTLSHHLKIRSSKLMDSLFLGNFKAAFHGKGIEFQDFREYSPGDDAKYIDWLTSSREGKTIMRRYREEKQGNILCMLDVSQSLYFQKEKISLCKEVILLLQRASHCSGESFGGYILDGMGSHYIPAKKTVTPTYKLLKFSQFPHKNTFFSCDFLLKSPLKRSIIFIVSDSLDVDMRSLKIASKKHDIIYVHISSHFENTLDGKGISHLRGRKLSYAVDLDDTILKESYVKKRKEVLIEFSKNLQSCGVDSIFLDEEKSLFTEFLTLMKKREKK